jgi:hypothetical protein
MPKCNLCNDTGFFKGKVCTCISKPTKDPIEGDDLFSFLKRTVKGEKN